MPQHPVLGLFSHGILQPGRVASSCLDGSDATLTDFTWQALLVVNVASQCGFTKQDAGLEALHERYRGFSVLGFPSNQFGAQEPGTAEEIAEFCSVNFGVIFPLFAKTDVNGPDRHPVFSRLTETADATGEAGDVKWNFEKFLISPHGAVAGRFRSQVEPHDADLDAAIEAVLPRRPGASGHDGYGACRHHRRREPARRADWLSDEARQPWRSRTVSA